MQHQFKLPNLISLKHACFSRKRFQDGMMARLADSIQGSQLRRFHRRRSPVKQDRCARKSDKGKQKQMLPIRGCVSSTFRP
jgi:hypothetical protein